MCYCYQVYKGDDMGRISVFGILLVVVLLFRAAPQGRVCLYR